MSYRPIAPYLDFSDLTGRVYIVMSENKKIDVTAQFEDIAREKSANCLFVKCDDGDARALKELLKDSESVIAVNNDDVDIIRCKDCANRGDGDACPLRHLVYNNVEDNYCWVDITTDDSFCSLGERNQKVFEK